MHKVFFTITFFLVLGGLNCSRAQQEQYRFKHLDVNHGLSQNQVLSFLKDSKGFIWIGTTAGLNRYDGYAIRVFRNDAGDSTSIINNNISRLFEVPDGRLGVVTSGGLTLYDPTQEKFQRDVRSLYEAYEIPAGTILDVKKGSHNDFWFVQRNSIIHYDSAKRRSLLIAHRPGDTTSLVADSITSFSHDTNGNNWVIHENGVFEKFVVTGSGWKVVYRNDFFAKRNRNRNLDYRVLADADGDLWFFVANDNQGVHYFNTARKTFQHFHTGSGKLKLNTNIVGGMVQDNNGLIWVGTDHGGINLIDKKRFTVRYIYHRDEDEKTIAQNSINTIYKDDQGIVWIGTYKRGVSYYHQDIFRFPVYKHFTLDPTSLPYADVNRFVEDDKGNLWIGTNGGGLLYFERRTGRFTQYRSNPGNVNSLSSDVIVSLCIDHQGILWIGTYYGGLNAFDGNRFRRFNNDPNDTTSLSGRSVWEIYEDSKHNLWVGTLEGGLNLFKRETNSFKRFKTGGPNAIQSNYISAILEDRQGNMWFGTSAGIDILSPEGNFTHYDLDPLQSNNTILDIKEDARGRIWVGTHAGLSLMDRRTTKVTRFTERDGLPHNAVLTILEDSNANLWLGTPGGLAHMIFGTDSLPHDNVTFRNYSEADGLQGRQFNENAAYKTRRGELVFGGPYGFNIFKAEQLEGSDVRPHVVFTDFQLFQKSVGIGEPVNGKVILERSITEESSLVLPPDKNFFSIEFTALNFLHPEKIEYRYKLDGLNTDWLPVDKNSRKITFTSLNPGDYVLHVKATNLGGTGKEGESQLAVTVLPPFWKTKTAFVLYVLFLISILYLARKIIQQREQMKFVIEQERQEAMRMHELDRMKIRFFTNVSHEFRTPLTLILTPLERMLKQAREPEQQDQYKLIHRNAKRLLNLVNQLLDFRKLEVQEIRFNPSEGDILAFIKETVYSFSDLAEKKDIAFSFRSSVRSLETLFDQDKLEKILFNLLSNAFKFTPEHGAVTVAVQLDEAPAEKRLRIEVRDTGIGIPADKQERIFERFFQHDLPRTIVNQGSGIGLSITKEFVRIHNGTISVQSEPGKGSCFTVVIPIREVFLGTAAPVAETVSRGGASNEETQVLEAEPALDGNSTRTLLLVEDNDDFRFYLKDNLKLHFTILEARNGQEGWKKVLDHQPDLVVSDVMMPEWNGIELCRKIKEDQRVSHIPVILLTARTSEEQKLEGFETGADDYITKPFNFEILESRIRNLVAQREKLHRVVGKRLDVMASELNITPLDTKFIENAIKCVEKNVSSPDFSVEHLGKELGISRAYLYKKIMSLTGKSPLEFIRNIRLQHAAQLLEKSQLTVAEVAYQVGFNNPKYFTRYFKEQFHMLPSQYAGKKKK